MLRPATPLAVLLFIAFGLLLISVLSVPIIKAIPLGEYVGVTFGVFGYCKGNACSKIEIGYDDGLSTVLNDSDSATFDLPSSTRRTLSTILIVHPVAAFITLVQLILSIVAHFHSPSHSVRYLLVVFIIGILNTIVCLLAFLIDVLLFVPHMAWGSYIVLAATILVALSGLVSCAMRRTLVSRKTRKKRIAENAEMSGENFYKRQAQQQGMGNTATVETKQPTVPVLSGANGTGDKLPTFASFEKKDDRSSDERVPLTSRSPSNRSPNGNEQMMYNNAPPRPSRSPSVPGSRDQYGNPIEPVDGYGMRRGPSFERMRGRGGGSPGGYRGRGGYGPPGRGGGGYGGYGPPPGRGGYGRGGYGPPGGRGGYGPPPRGYGPPPMRGGRPTPPPPGYQYERRGSPADGYGPGPAPGGYGMNNVSMPSLDGSYNAYGGNNVSDRDSDLPRAESPPPLPGVDDMQIQNGVVGRGPGMAVEIDGTGSSQQAPGGFGQFRDSDADIAGMVGLQQGLGPMPAQRHDTYVSDRSRYSQDEQYVPPRQAWNNSPSVPQPLNIQRSPPQAPAELPTGTGSRSGTPQAAAAAATAAATTATTSREVTSTYYEDIDPRFAEPSPRRTPPPAIQTNVQMPFDDDDDNDVVSDHPVAFGQSNSGDSGNGGMGMIGGSSSSNLAPAPPRSPAESERSTFTSISQRGINPRWQPAPPALMPGFSQPRRPVVNRNDVLLDNNPDFELPVGPARGSPARGVGTAGGGAYPSQPL